jgi:8-oxo-dGTP diphosphatase
LARYYQRLGFYPRGVVDGLLRHDKRLLPEAGVVVASLDAVDFGRWRPDRVATLMFVVRDGRILLIRKLRGHGAGKINAPGGMVEAGETPLQCALRETEEEVHVRAHAPAPLAQLCFQDTDGSSMLGYAFLTDDYSGEPRETAEAVPFWCPLEQIPYGQMWDDDVVWLPRLLDRLPSVGEFLMRDGRLVAHRLRSATQSELVECTNRPVG